MSSNGFTLEIPVRRGEMTGLIEFGLPHPAVSQYVAAVQLAFGVTTRVNLLMHLRRRRSVTRKLLERMVFHRIPFASG